MAINMFVRTVKQAEKVKKEARYLKSSIAPCEFWTRGVNTKGKYHKNEKVRLKTLNFI